MARATLDIELIANSRDIDTKLRELRADGAAVEIGGKGARNLASDLDRAKSAAQGVESAARDIDGGMTRAAGGVKKIETELDGVKAAAGAAGSAAGEEFSSGFEGATDGIGDGLADRISGAAGGGGGVLGGLGSTLGTAFGGPLGVAAGGAIVAGVGVAVGAIASQMQTIPEAMRQLQNATGATGDELENLGDIAENVFVNTVGGSIEDAYAKVAELDKTLGRLRDSAGEPIIDVNDYEQIAIRIDQVAHALGGEFTETVGKLRTLTSAYGDEGPKVFDMVLYASQNAKVAQDDLLDTFDEYSGLVSQAGFELTEWTETLVNAAESGVWNLDKIADAIKETQIRVLAGDYADPLADIAEGASDIEREVVNSIQSIAQRAQSGEISIADMMKISSQEIQRAFEDGKITQSLQDQINVALSGTPAEDIGAEWYNRIFGAEIDPAMIEQKAAEAAEAIDGQFSMEKFQRNIDLLLARLGESVFQYIDPVIQIINDELLPALDGMFGESGEQSEQFREELIEMARNAIPPLVTAIKLAAEYGQRFATVIFDSQAATSRLWSAISRLMSAITGGDTDGRALDVIMDAIVDATTTSIQVFTAFVTATSWVIEQIINLGEAAGLLDENLAAPTLTDDARNQLERDQQDILAHSVGILRLGEESEHTADSTDNLSNSIDKSAGAAGGAARQMRDYADAIARINAEAQTLGEENRIAAIGDSAERELETLRLKHNNELSEIERQAEAIRAADDISARQREQYLEALGRKRNEIIARQSREMTEQLTSTATDAVEAERDRLAAESSETIELINGQLELITGADEAAIRERFELRRRALAVEHEQELRALAEQNDAIMAAEVELARLNRAGAPIEQITAQHEKINQLTSEFIATSERARLAQSAYNAELRAMNDEYTLDIREANIQQIQDVAIRERELSLLEAEKLYRERLELAAGNQQLEYDAWVEFLMAKGAAEQSYLDDTSGILTQAAQAAVGNITDAFSSIEFVGNEEMRRDAEETVNTVESEMRELRDEYENGIITYEQYNERLNELDEQRLDALQQMADAQIDIWGTIQNELANAMGNAAAMMGQDLDQSISRYDELAGATAQADKDIMEARSKAETALRDGNLADYERYNGELQQMMERRNEAEEESAELTGQIYGEAAAMVGLSFAQMVLEGQSAVKATALAVLKGLRAMIPMYATQIMGQSLAQLGPGGLAVAGLLTGSLYALVGAAEAGLQQLSFRHGGLMPETGQSGLQSPGLKLIWLNDDGTGRSEYVMNADVTARNRHAFEVMNRENIGPEEYVGRYMTQLANNIVINSNQRATQQELRAIRRELRLSREERRRNPVNISFRRDARGVLEREEVRR